MQNYREHQLRRRSKIAALYRILLNGLTDAPPPMTGARVTVSRLDRRPIGPLIDLNDHVARQREIVRILKTDPGMEMADVVSYIGADRRVVLSDVKALQRAGLVVRTDERRVSYLDAA